MKEIRNLSIENFISPAIIVEPVELVSKAVGLMEEKDSYEVFTMVGDKVATVTIRDLLNVKSFRDAQIEPYFVYLPKITANADILQAARIMAEYRLRSLPIVEKNKIIGKIDVRTIVNVVKDSNLGELRAQKIMTPSPVMLLSGEKIGKARSIMIRRKFDHLPVVDNFKIKGMITSSQIVSNLIPNMKGRYIIRVPEDFNPLGWPVDNVMDSNPLECDPQDTIRKVADDMLQIRLSYSLVTVGNEELQGIITYRDFARLISEISTSTEIPVYITGLPDDPFEAEATRIKFVRMVETLSRTHRPLLEARSTIKTSSTQGSRRRYEVSVSIRTPKETHSYRLEGWELPAIYDELANRIKKILPDREKRQKRIDKDKRFP